MPEYGDAERDERHSDDVGEMDAVATPREGQDDDVPPVRVESDDDRSNDDRDRSHYPAQGTQRRCRGRSQASPVHS